MQAQLSFFVCGRSQESFSCLVIECNNSNHNNRVKLAYDIHWAVQCCVAGWSSCISRSNWFFVYLFCFASFCFRYFSKSKAGILIIDKVKFLFFALRASDWIGLWKCECICLYAFVSHCICNAYFWYDKSMQGKEINKMLGYDIYAVRDII